MALNLHQLRVFQAIVEAGSVTAGSRALHISQPAASKQLADLETSLGVSLLERRARGVKPTAAGELLQHHARRLFQEERAAEDALRALLGLQQGRLAVGASTTIGNYLVPRVFGRLHRAHPGIALELQVGNTADIQQRLLGGNLDIGLTEGGVLAKALRVETLLHDELVLIVSPHHPLASTGSVPHTSLGELPVLVRERGSGTRAIVEAALAQRGVTLNPSMTLGSTEALKNAVEAELGVALVSRLTVEQELLAGRLAELHVDGLNIHRELHLVTVEGASESPVAREFLRLLRAEYPLPEFEEGR